MSSYRIVAGRRVLDGPLQEDHAEPSPVVSTASRPKSEACLDTERSAGHPPESDRLAHGHVVHWTRARTSGLGQVDRIDDGMVTVRPWLPTRSHTVVVPVVDVTPLWSLTTVVLPALLAGNVGSHGWAIRIDADLAHLGYVPAGGRPGGASPTVVGGGGCRPDHGRPS